MNVTRPKLHFDVYINNSDGVMMDKTNVQVKAKWPALQSFLNIFY